MARSEFVDGYYEVTVRLPIARYSEGWFERVADAAGEHAAVSGSIVPWPTESNEA